MREKLVDIQRPQVKIKKGDTIEDYRFRRWELISFRSSLEEPSGIVYVKSLRETAEFPASTFGLTVIEGDIGGDIEDKEINQALDKMGIEKEEVSE
jgi:hypothetical protein